MRSGNKIGIYILFACFVLSRRCPEHVEFAARRINMRASAGACKRLYMRFTRSRFAKYLEATL